MSDYVGSCWVVLAIRLYKCRPSMLASVSRNPTLTAADICRVVLARVGRHVGSCVRAVSGPDQTSGDNAAVKHLLTSRWLESRTSVALWLSTDVCPCLHWITASRRQTHWAASPAFWWPDLSHYVFISKISFAVNRNKIGGMEWERVSGFRATAICSFSQVKASVGRVLSI